MARIKLTEEERIERKRIRNSRNYITNREKIQEQARAYRNANRDKIRKQERAYRNANRDKIRKQERARRAANREKIREQKGAYRNANRDKIRKQERARRAANREKIREQKRALRAANPGDARASLARNRAKRLQRAPIWTTYGDQEEVNRIYREAAYLTATTGTPHHVDHIYPLNNESLCGLHVSWNLQVIPKEENKRKSNRLPQDFYENWDNHSLNLRNDRLC